MNVLKSRKIIQIPQHPLVARIQCTYRCRLNCPGCPIALRSKKSPKDPTYRDVLCRVFECYNLGIRCIEWAGGDPLLWPGIKKISKLCKQLGIATLLPVSGQGLVNSFKTLGTSWLDTPGVIRVSTHVNRKFGIDTLDSVKEALGVVTNIRPQGSTQLSIVLTPGPEGNIRQEFLELLLSIAYEYKCLVHLVPALGTWQNRNWAEFDLLWRGATDEERMILLWLIRQSGVLASGIKKVLDRLCPIGSNNLKSHICRAGIDVVTISSGRAFGPCPLMSNTIVMLKESLKEALCSDDWLSCIESRGTFEECEGCTAGCHGAMGALSGLTDPLEIIEAFYTM